MDRAAFRALLATAQGLSPAEAKELMAVLRVKFAEGGQVDEGDRGLLYEALRDELRRDYGGDVPAYGLFRTKHPLRTDYGAAADRVEQFVTRAMRDATPTKQRRVAAYQMIAQLVVRAARRGPAEIPIMRRVCTQLDNVGSLVDRAMPGYVESGLFSVLCVKSLDAARGV